MLKKAAALLLVGAGLGAWVGCGKTSNRFLYAAIPGSSEIVAFREDPNGGVLNQLVGSPITAGPAVETLLIHPSRKFLVAANSGSVPIGTVSVFTINSSGSLTEKTPRASAGTAPTVMVMDSAGKYLYVGNSGSFDISVFSIDATQETLTPVPQAGGGATAPVGLSPLNMQLSPSGGTLYVSGQVGTLGYVEAFPVANGVLGPPITGSPYLTGNVPVGMVIDSKGSHLYTANKVDNSISEFSIASNGSLTLLSTTGEVYTSPVALLIDISGKYLYVANSQTAGNVAAYSIGSDGGLALLSNSPFGTAAQPNFIATDPNGAHLFVGNQTNPVIQSFTLDPGSGTLTSIASYSVPGTPTSMVITK
ncbi:MAG TPA: beta-propeller fold lactonase family protein [Candidatus Sulfotelmatobacter sp.]|nr:beta-propeller fold lactonase family protein [Candidatus Sulfotelmatobacter sp.]